MELMCPVYMGNDMTCWLVSGNYCRDQIRGKFAEKMEMCLECDVFELNMDPAAMKATIAEVNKQFGEFRKTVQQRNREMEGMNLELALGLSEVFEALKKISSGDRSVQMPERSKVELITELKHMVNLTAKKILILGHLPIAFYTARSCGSPQWIWVSAQIERISGFPAEKYIGDPQFWISRIHQDDRERVLREFDEICTKGAIAMEYRYECAGGSYNWFSDHAVLICGDRGEPVEIVGAVLDITERKQTEEALRTLSLADELTGLYNRRGFFTLAEKQLRIANRMKKKMLLLFADLDDLKWINDNMGHSEGDTALIDVANILKKTFRESDFVARIGGDEFVVLAIESEEVNVEVLGRRLEENLRAYNAERERSYDLSISAGVSRFNPESQCSIDELIGKADKYMYRHKRKKTRRLTTRNAVSLSVIQ